MKIFINIGALAQPLTGIGHYTANLIEQMLASPDIEDIKAIYYHRLLDQPAIERLIRSTRTSSMSCHPLSLARHIISRLPFSRKALLHLQQQVLRRATPQLRGYVYWEPNYLRLPVPCKTVLTVHDLSHLEHPEFHPSARVHMLNRYLPSSIEKSTRIITVSQYSKARIRQYFPTEKPIDIVPPGVGEAFFMPSEQIREECRQYFKLPEQFILSVATLEPRKNLARLIEAFQGLPETLRAQYPLVISGVEGWKSHKLVQQIKILEQKKQLIRLGYVPQAYLPALYACATITAYISLYEGFGMPVVESMAAGTPVITSNRTSMPEAASDSAALVNPEDILEIRQRIATLLTHPELRQSMIQKGLKRANQLTWKKSALALMQTLHKAAHH